MLLCLMAFNVLDSYLLTYLNYSILHFLYIVKSFNLLILRFFMF